LRGQDVLSALPPKPTEHPVPRSKEVEAANAAPTDVIESPAAAQEALRKEEADRPALAGRSGAQGADMFRARMLEMFDKNKDGRLDEEERAAAQKYAEEHGLRPGVAMATTREELLKRFDKNGDGKLDDQERAAMQAALARERIAKAGNPAEMLRTEMLRRFDRNGNGRIDDDEMDAIDAMRTRFAAAPILRQRFDKNGDGKIDDEEWAAARGPLQQWLNEPAKKVTR
jgi:Ca2+-binding EF-hand superfamily protein